MTRQIQSKGGAVVGAYNAKPNLESRRKDMKYKVDTKSTTTSGVVPIRGATKYPAEPEIYFTREAWVKQCHLVKMCNKEVGWFAMVDYDETDNSFTITELVIPCQEVTAAETDIGKEDLADAAMELIEQGKDTSKLYAWFHSHVNMGVTPSGQDEYQVEDYLEDLADQPEVPAFIRGIQNKAGNLKLDVYYIQHGVAYQNVDFYVIHDDDPQWLVDIESEIKNKVTERTYQYYNGYGGGRYNTGKSQSGGNANNKSENNSFRRNDSLYDGRGYGGYDDWDDWDAYYGLNNNDIPPVGTSIDTADDPHTPKAVIFPAAKTNRMEVVYASPSNVEVMMCDEGKLWVCDESGDMYDYEEYTETYGEIDGNYNSPHFVLT
jgi:hypothetical protein